MQYDLQGGKGNRVNYGNGDYGMPGARAQQHGACTSRTQCRIQIAVG